MAREADKTVLTLYLNNASSVDRPPPALMLRKRRFTGPTPPGENPRKTHCVLSPEAKWQVLTDAREVRADPGTVVRLRRADAEYGSEGTSAEGWMRKEQAMYSRRTSIALSCGASHAFYPPSRAPHIILICCNKLIHIMYIIIYIYIIIYKNTIS